MRGETKLKSMGVNSPVYARLLSCFSNCLFEWTYHTNGTDTLSRQADFLDTILEGKTNCQSHSVSALRNNFLKKIEP
jgi:hypothetical protein